MERTFPLYLEGEGQNLEMISPVGMGRLSSTVGKAMHYTALEKLRVS
jgi:hypothetical protein